MYWINFDGVFEMYANSQEEIKKWMRENEAPAAIPWSQLDETGETGSLCEKWYILKDEETEPEGLPHISRFKWLFNDLVMIKAEEQKSEIYKDPELPF